MHDGSQGYRNRNRIFQAYGQGKNVFDLLRILADISHDVLDANLAERHGGRLRFDRRGSATGHPWMGGGQLRWRISRRSTPDLDRNGPAGFSV